MTAEQIVELRRICAERYAASDLTPMQKAMVKVLDEREALLKAAVHLRDRVEMRDSDDWCRGEGDVDRLGAPAPCGDAVALQETKEAIAKAEAP